MYCSSDALGGSPKTRTRTKSESMPLSVVLGGSWRFWSLVVPFGCHFGHFYPLLPDRRRGARDPKDCYAHIASGIYAQNFIREFYRSDPPFKRAQTDTVAVEAKSVMPTSDRTYEVEWIETTRDLYGTIKSTDHWKGRSRSR
jgi:hypothetical protein